ncbi:MAG: lipid-A-disaccharide synthase, partial [Cyanobacteria bacterium J06639_1]
MAGEVDILILSNGPGELSTWVRPVVEELRDRLPAARLSLILSPCTHASGQETDMARQHLGLDRVQAPQHFTRYLLTGRTADHWDWHPRGVVVFLGGDQFFALWIAKRLGYRIVVYAEWEARWQRWVDAFGVRTVAIAEQFGRRFPDKMTVVGDLLVDSVARTRRSQSLSAKTSRESAQRHFPEGWRDRDAPQRRPQIALLPGSKAAKLAIGTPLCLAVADCLRQAVPEACFVIPVAPVLALDELASYARRDSNPVIDVVGGTAATLKRGRRGIAFVTEAETEISLWTDFPAHSLLAQSDVCITTVGANTAELGQLGVPMVVVIPLNKLDAMRAWDGPLGLLVNLPWVGSAIAKLVNWIAHRYLGLLAWPNRWAGEEIVPELRGHLTPQDIADVAADILKIPSRQQQIRDRLKHWQ